MRKLAVLALLFAALLAAPASAGIGASPGSITYSQLLRAGYAESWMTVSNPGAEPVDVSVGAEGQIAPWLAIAPRSFTVQPLSFAIIKLTIQPPPDVPNGVYNGTILIMGKPPAVMPAEGAAVAVATAVGVLVSAEVSDVQRLEYRIEDARLPDTEECRPIQLITSVRNTGNVRERARFDINIVSDGTVVKSHSWTSEEMLPTKVYTLISRVPYQLEQFRCVPVGSYIASFSAWLDGKLMYTDSLPFKVWERGTLTLAGAIVQLTAPPNITLGETARIAAIFHNTGQLPVLAKLKAEIYRKSLTGEARLVDTVEGPEHEVNLGSTETLTAYYKPGWPGDYVVKATVLFEGRASEPAEAQFRVLLPLAAWVSIGAGIVIAVALVLLLILRRLRRK